MRVGQRPEEDGIDRAEDRGAGADAEGQRQRTDDGESRMAAQLAGGVAEIGGEGSECVFPSIRAHLLANDGRVAEFEASCAPGVLCAQAARLPGCDSFFEILADLVVGVAVLYGSMNEAAEAVAELTPKGHGLTLLTEKALNGGGAAGPVRGFDFELLFSAARKPVELCAAGVFRLSPLGVEPSGALQALQSGEQRSRIHLEHATRDLFDAAADAEPVQRLETEGFEDQHIQRALDDVGVGVAHGRPR